MAMKECWVGLLSWVARSTVSPTVVSMIVLVFGSPEVAIGFGFSATAPDRIVVFASPKEVIVSGSKHLWKSR